MEEIAVDRPGSEQKLNFEHLVEEALHAFQG